MSTVVRVSTQIYGVSKEIYGKMFIFRVNLGMWPWNRLSWKNDPKHALSTSSYFTTQKDQQSGLDIWRWLTPQENYIGVTQCYQAFYLLMVLWGVHFHLRASLPNHGELVMITPYLLKQSNRKIIAIALFQQVRSYHNMDTNKVGNLFNYGELSSCMGWW